jgi:hypothetical protein
MALVSITISLLNKVVDVRRDFFELLVVEDTHADSTSRGFGSETMRGVRSGRRRGINSSN